MGEMMPLFEDADKTGGAATEKFRDGLIGKLLEMQRRNELAPAIDHWKSLLAADPANAEMDAQLKRVAQLLNQCGVSLYKEGKVEEALACFSLSLRASEKNAPALYNNIAGCLWDLGRVEESDAAYRQALALRPDMASAASGLLFSMHYKPGVTLAALAVAHRQWNERYGAGKHTPPQHYANDPQPERSLRVGLVSPDFGNNPVGILLVRYLENADRAQVNFICYANARHEGPVAERIRSAAANWFDVSSVDDEKLAARIQADTIDILIDLTGHLSKNRLGVFARKPAPVQIVWLGYPGDTGLSAMDYIIGDSFVSPKTMQPHMHAKILHLPRGFICFDPPTDAPPVTALPAKTPGALTFGAFHNPAKCNPEVIAVWAEILSRLPQSRLVFKYKGFGATSTQNMFREQFAARGIGAARLEFRGESPMPQMFAEMNGIDLMLDPFPFAGGMMTLFALWMGVPVLTLPRETFASRQGMDFLTVIDITDTIAKSRDDYVEKAVTLAHDLPRLTDLRKKLRPAMMASPLCDGPGAAADLQDLLRKVWRDWCTAAS